MRSMLLPVVAGEWIDQNSYLYQAKSPCTAVLGAENIKHIKCIAVTS